MSNNLKSNIYSVLLAFAVTTSLIMLHDYFVSKFLISIWIPICILAVLDVALVAREVYRERCLIALEASDQLSKMDNLSNESDIDERNSSQLDEGDRCVNTEDDCDKPSLNISSTSAHSHIDNNKDLANTSL